MLTDVEPPGPGPKRIGASASRCAAGAIRREFATPLIGAPACGWLSVTRPAESAAAHVDVAVDAKAAGRPVIGNAAAAEDARLGAVRPDDIGVVIRAAPPPGKFTTRDLAG